MFLLPIRGVQPIAIKSCCSLITSGKLIKVYSTIKLKRKFHYHLKEENIIAHIFCHLNPNSLINSENLKTIQIKRSLKMLWGCFFLFLRS